MTADRTPAWCECSPVSDATYEVDAGDSVSLAVVEALAAAEGVPPSALEPLHDAVDCSALDRLFEGNGSRPAASMVLRFSVDGWNVFVRDDGAVRVCDPDADVEPAPVFERPFGG